jgi:RNA polymerase sigma-70 factor, ECF subfamily
MTTKKDITCVAEISPPSGHVPAQAAEEKARSEAATRRLSAMVEREFDFVWRTARRLGLSAASAEDVTQEVFLVASRRLSDIAHGSERAFLYRTATLVTATARRSVARRRENFSEDSAVSETESTAPDPEAIIAAKEARELLDDVLAELDADSHEVFLLFELDGMPIPEIAELVGIPEGTVKSRLRKARTDFHAAIERLHVREAFQRRRR